MNRKIILTGDIERGKTVKSDLTVPSQSRDIRLVAEAGQAPQRKSFKVKMARETKSDQRARPVRKIKLNRSIFNSGFQGKPSFHVKTLDEIKSEKKETKATETVTTQAVINDSVYTSTTKANIEENNISGNTRKIVRLDTAKKLLLPTIQLTRISSGNYSRSVTKSAVPGNGRGVIRSEKSLQRFKSLEASSDGETVGRAPVRSPAKKRKLSPIRSPGSEPQVKYQAVDTARSPRMSSFTAFTAQDQQTSTPLPPASPPLSLGAQSDSDLNDEPELHTSSGTGMIINTTNNQSYNSPSKAKVQHKFLTPSSDGLKSDSGTTRHSFLLLSGVSSTFDDDKLDVMSVLADDDELFQDVNPRPMLKRSLSQDSVFDMAEDHGKSGDLRSLLTKTKDSGSAKKHSVGEHINTSKRVSKSFKIPVVNQNSGKESGDVMGGRKGPRFHHEKSRSEGSSKGPQRRESRSFLTNPPKGKTLEHHRSSSQSCSHDHPQKSEATATGGHRSKGFSPEGQSGLLDGIKVNLGHGNVGDAWSWIKKLDQTNCVIDVRILEETLSVCERVSRSTPIPVLGEAALGVFEIIKRQGNVKPTDFVMLILTLGRCQRVQEAFSNYQAMKVLRKFPPEQSMERFIGDFCKCLVICPAKIVEVIQDVKWFPFLMPKKIAIVNSCVSFLISCQSNKLREVNTGLWNSLLAMLCSPPTSNVQSACQVHNLMEQNGVALNPSTILQLLNLFQESKSIKPLLNLLCAKDTMKILAKQNSPVDVGQILSSPTIDVQQLEACYAGLIKDGTMPTEVFLHHFITKASLVKDYGLIYQFFLKCERSPLSLPVSTLKEMMEVLESWDDNPDASVQVYATLRQARKAPPNKPAPHLVVKKEEPRNPPDRFVNGGFHWKPCFSFMQRGYCHRGSYCKYSHDTPSHQFPTRESEQSERESIDEGQKPKDIGAAVDVKLQSNSKTTSPVDNPGLAVFNTALPNGLNHNPPKMCPPFPSFQVFRPAVPPRTFNPQVFNKMRGDRPPFTKPQFHAGNPLPRFHGPCNSHPRAPGIRLPGRPPSIAPRPPFMSDSHFSVPQPSKPPRPVRSFSWEPTSSVKTKLSNDKDARQSPTDTNLVNDSNNNASGKAFYDLQRHVEMAVKSKEWQKVYAVYAECKGSSSQDSKNKDLQLFRSGLVKDTSAGLGQNFKAFVEFLYKENNSGKSCGSNQSVKDVFDEYDIEFIGAIGVSLMERCLVLKQFDAGYDVLLTLHSHNISYFQSGKNFGAYTKDIPAQNVALIAVKLCLGIAEHGLLGAMEVLRASDYASAEEGEILSQKEGEYRIKILHQLFTRLFEESHVLEAFEVVQNLNASPKVTAPMYGAVLNHYVASNDFDQSFTVLVEMQEKGLGLNILPCQMLYEKFLKQCVEMQRYNRAMITLKEMESRAIQLSGEALRDILSSLSSAEQCNLANLLLEKCIGLEIFPKTFCKGTPWLCELACGYSELELRLLIQKHLEQVHEHLLCTSRNNQLITGVQNLEIVLFPRLSGVKSELKFTDGIQSNLIKDGVTIEGILHDLNPPLAIVEQSGEQFHKKIIVEKMSIYRWFSANIHDSQRAIQEEELLEEDEISSQESIGSDISDLSDLLV